MRRSPIKRPTGETLEAAFERQRQKRSESAKRWQEKQRREASKSPAGGKSRKPIRKRNPRRSAQAFQRNFHSEAFVAWVHSLGCSVPSCNAQDIEAAHARSVGAGGTWEDVLPLCVRHHRMQHDMGIRTFERRVGFHLADVAATVNLRWRAFSEGGS